MKHNLAVLIVEDSENDALLLTELMEASGFTLSHKRIWTASQFEKALTDQKWDLIVSDYSLPQFTGLDALKIFNNHNLEIPFIVVSGAIGEKTAVQLMKNGAHDYVMKENLHRLIPAIERELKEAKNRRDKIEAENALENSEEKFRLAFNYVIIFNKFDLCAKSYGFNYD